MLRIRGRLGRLFPSARGSMRGVSNRRSHCHCGGLGADRSLLGAALQPDGRQLIFSSRGAKVFLHCTDGFVISPRGGDSRLSERDTLAG